MEASALHAPQGHGRLTASRPLLRLCSDDQLVALFRRGHDDAFRVIFDRHRRQLFAYVRQMLGGSRSDAEDALQDVFLRAYSALRTDDRPVTLRAWLYRVAHNRCVDQLRRGVPPPADVLALSRTPVVDPPAEAERREHLRHLVTDVRRLPEQQRSALLMRELEGLSYEELAAALDVSVPAVKSLLVRARSGLVAAGEARDAACAEIRGDLLAAHDRRIRCDARARRHLRDCDGCRAYQQALRATRRGAAGWVPGPGPLGALTKLLGLGGAGSGVAAGGGALVGGGGVAAGGVAAGGVAAGTASKVAAALCCVAVIGGGAAEVRHHAAQAGHRAHQQGQQGRQQPQHARSAIAGGVAAPAAAPHVLPEPAAGAAGAVVGSEVRVRPARSAPVVADQVVTVDPVPAATPPATTSGGEPVLPGDAGGVAGPTEGVPADGSGSTVFPVMSPPAGDGAPETPGDASAPASPATPVDGGATASGPATTPQNARPGPARVGSEPMVVTAGTSRRSAG